MFEEQLGHSALDGVVAQHPNYGFVRYLSKISPAWRSEVGYATSVGFPTGVGAKGNAGVTATVTKTPGAIDYIKASYIIAAGLRRIGPEQGRRLRTAQPENIEAAGAIVKSVPPTTN